MRSEPFNPDNPFLEIVATTNRYALPRMLKTMQSLETMLAEA
jgi:hypothetical protein